MSPIMCAYRHFLLACKTVDSKSRSEDSCILIYEYRCQFCPFNENQAYTLFILILFRPSTSTCFGHICFPSSVCILYIYNIGTCCAFQLTLCRPSNRQSTEEHNGTSTHVTSRHVILVFKAFFMNKYVIVQII